MSSAADVISTLRHTTKSLFLLNLKALSEIVADNILDLLLLFFREYKPWYFVWIVCRRFTWNIKYYLEAIHMKCQMSNLFSLKSTEKISTCI